MSITALPTPPSRSDPANFATRADAFHTALPTFATEANVLQADVNAKQVLATAAAATAQAALDAGLANAASNAATAQAAAASAVSVVQQDLSVIDRTVFASTALVDACLYDTSKDSDGGAWRKRCGHTSWENETLSGNWLGSAANEAAARAISGAVTGSYYYDTTAAVFRKLNAGSGVTEVFRGNARQFPAQVLITVETARVVLWDVTQAGAPMWMVFSGASNNVWSYNNGKAARALNGQICIADGTYDLYCIGLIRDRAWRYSTSGISGNYKNSISARNSGAGHATDITAVIVNRACNDVAMTVLPSAPVDVATGLPVPTIAVATAGGVSVIKNDGTVVNSNGATGADDLCIVGTRLWCGVSSNGGYLQSVELIGIGASFTLPAISAPWTAWPNGGSTVFGITGKSTRREQVSRGSNAGVVKLHYNETTAASSMIAYITKDYNSGWLPGDIRGAWLADTVAETLTGAELVTNGTFGTDTSGWTTSGSTFVQSGGAAVLTNSAAAAGYAYQAITTVSGKTYVVRADLTLGTAAAPRLLAGTSFNGAELGSHQLTASGVFNLSFTATGTTTYISCATNSSTSGHTATFDNISCRRADADRSVKAKGMQAFGSITKAAVASGAQLMGYSGFSAANYLEQPYNSDLDFGTGDFCFMGWVKLSNTTSWGGIFERSVLGGTIGVRLIKNNTGSLLFDYPGTSIGAAHGVDVWTLVACARESGVKKLYLNGALSASVADTTNVTIANAQLHFADYQSGSAWVAPLSVGTLALWRTSAYAPSADQIKHIYETEKALFEAGAQCCLAGSSNAVTALAYDDEADLLHVGTSYGRSAFKGLVRVTSEATPVGSIVALTAGAGIVSQAGASGADVYVPAYSLREELLRDAEQMARFGQNLIAHDYSATSSQTTFTLPIGWEIVAVYAQGAIKQEGATKDWTRTFDGFRWSVVFASGRSTSDWISILAKRT